MKTTLTKAPKQSPLNNPKKSTKATSNGDGTSERKRTEDAKTNKDQIEAHANNNA